MDFFTVLNQRQLDQTSELRRLYRVSACYAIAAIIILFLASMVVPAGSQQDLWRSDFKSALYVLTFIISSLAGYILMVKALNVLSTNRFILPSSSYAVPRPTPTTFLFPIPHESLTCRQRFILIYGLMLITMLCLYIGLTTKSFYGYLFLLMVQLALFAVSWVSLSRMMNFSR